jgi:hypothetical protein
MKLLLEGSLTVLVLLSELVGLVALAKGLHRDAPTSKQKLHDRQCPGGERLSVGGVGRHLLQCVGGPEGGLR